MAAEMQIHVYSDLTLPMLKLLSSEVQGCKDISKSSKPYHVGIHWIALAEFSQISTNVPGFLSFSGFFKHFLMAKLAVSSLWVNRVALLIVPLPLSQNALVVKISLK